MWSTAMWNGSMARLFAVETPVPAARPELRTLAGSLVDAHRPGDWAQALMDLGATVCRPKSPSCLLCPISQWCAGYRTGKPERYPVKTKKAERPHRQGVAWVLRDKAGRVALVQRPDKGLLGGMLGLPTSEWGVEAAGAPPANAEWRDAGAIKHVFTHFSLTLSVRVAEGKGDFVWTDEAAALKALPTVFRKALERGLASAL
jgi:A/G-specific adenine glycosylase